MEEGRDEKGKFGPGNKLSVGNAGGDGGISKYKKVFCKKAFKLCLLGATDLQLADFFEVSESCINAWKRDHSEFKEALTKGKQEADSKVANALYNRALGYSHKDVELKVVSLGGNMGSEVQKVDIVKHYPPDTAAASWWLKNRQPALWRDKQEIDIKRPIDLNELSEEDLLALAQINQKIIKDSTGEGS